ncbi:MAG: CYTH domain-containing protein [Bacteroidetes bacterium]|nr:CYTH domain-containing protein [Bacteroidota bacterium]
MPIEIEHKYLVKQDLWKAIVPEKSIEIKQAYLLTDPKKTIRIRTKGNQGYITIKGKSIGASRPEFEYEIPFDDACEMITKFSISLIEKTRHYVNFGNKLWEVDEFKGPNIGLIVAEIELANENEGYTIPEWVDKNVTDDQRYANSNLSLKPYGTW